MSWETRNGGGAYYTRSRRVDGRVVRTYFGAGELGELVAQLDQVKRTEREQNAAQRREEREQDAALDAKLAELCRLTDLLAHGFLLTAGFHKHHGQWRKKRVN